MSRNRKGYNVTLPSNYKDLTIDEIVQEQCSGQLPFDRRDKAFELLKKLKSNDHIICSHLDRFCRNTLSLLQMIQKFKKKKRKQIKGSNGIGKFF